MKGTIKKVFKDKGYGFITSEEKKDVFFGNRENEAIFDSLNEGDKVTYDVKEGGPKGPVAINVARAA